MDTIRLNDGTEIPQLGLGLRGQTDPDICEQVVLAALREGYLRFDTAQSFHNEAFLGNALSHCDVPRKEIFLSTKLSPAHYGKARLHIERSLKRLKTEYIDLLLLPHRCGKWQHAWKDMEWAREQGLVRSVGVCHFYLPANFHELEKFANLPPAVDQVECHPLIQQPLLKDELERQDIRLEAIYPLAGGKRHVLEHPVILDIAQKNRRTTMQIILRWHIQSGHIIFPGTRNPDHMRSNMHCFDFTLSREDMTRIASVDMMKSFFRRTERTRLFFDTLIG